MRSIRSNVGSVLSVSATLAAMGLCVSGAAATPPVEVVYALNAHAPGSPKAQVPGFSGATFSNFGRMFRSPTSNQWVVVPTTSITPTSQDQLLLIGSGLVGAVAAQEGVTSHSAGEFINFSGGAVPRINDAGQWAVAFRPAGLTAFDERAVLFNGAAFEVYGVFGDNIPALSLTYAGSNTAGNILSGGTMAWLASVKAISPTEALLTSNGASALSQVPITVPSGQVSGNTDTWADIDSGEFYTNADGASWIALGEVGTDTTRDKVAVVNNAVVVQESGFVAGTSATPSPVASVLGVFMESDGTWFVRGRNADGLDWIIRNGTPIAVEGQPIVPGSTELWESFQQANGNNAGSYVVIGNTNAGTLTDDVAVLNGVTLLARESEPVDLDNDGQVQANLFLHLLQDRAFLGNDRFFYFNARLKDSPTATAGVGGSTGASMLRVPTCPIDLSNNGVIDADDIFAFLSLWFDGPPGGTCAGCTADWNNDGSITADDIFAFLNDWFTAVPGNACP